MSSKSTDLIDWSSIVKYIQNYNGTAKIQRLFWIAEHALQFQAECQHLLAIEIKKGFDFNLNAKLCELSGNEALFDKAWVELTKDNFEKKRERLESELSIAKSSLGKETMRLKYSDLAFLFNEHGT